MPKLLHGQNKKIIASQVISASGLRQRIQGLIGRSGLSSQEAFWISSCPSIHTFFMKFPIDVVFTDNKFLVLSLFENVPAGRILFGGWKSRNVFEMSVGQIQSHNLKKGDRLYVEH